MIFFLTERIVQRDYETKFKLVERDYETKFKLIERDYETKFAECDHYHHHVDLASVAPNGNVPTSPRYLM